MSGYIGFEDHLENSPFLQFILSDKNILFIKHQTEHFLKGFHPDGKPIRIDKDPIYKTILNFYSKNKHIQRGDIHSRYHQCNDIFRSQLKELNDQVIVFLVDYIKAQILHETRFRTFNPWDANLITRKNITLKKTNKIKNAPEIEPRY